MDLDVEKMRKIHDLLCRLGARPNRTGFFYASCAVLLAAEEPERLKLIRRDLLPEVARRYGTTWEAVERDIRPVIRAVWKNGAAQLGELAGEPLDRCPRTARFLEILAASLRRGRAVQPGRG